MDTAAVRDAWERYALAARASRRERNGAGAETWLNWTSHADHGPDERVLGPLVGRDVLELGSGSGCNLAHLAALGSRCTGLDVSPTQTLRARERWGHLPGLTFVEGEAVDYLTADQQRYDVVLSIFGAAWFTDPGVLLPLVRRRLRAGGVLAFSHAHPEDAPPVPSRARIPRFDHQPWRWAALLREHGFRLSVCRVIPAPAGTEQRTLLTVGRSLA